tara:strand:+ start:821 stop:1222 length:402 start_codon:yes stop_codon:yes gene_type:complete
MRSLELQIKSNPIIRFLWLGLGLFFTGIGIIGLVIPGLPTTPLMILAAFCFLRSSKRLLRWVLKNKYYGESVKNFLDGKGISKKAKIISISMQWLFISFAVFSGALDFSLWVKIGVLFLALIGTLYIKRLPTY